MKKINCPKCSFTSGDDWVQCNKKCPMPMSPHYVGKNEKKTKQENEINKPTVGQDERKVSEKT